MKRALITGIAGQDGSYLAELLLARDTRCTASSAVHRHAADATGLGTIRLLESIRQLGSDCRFYQASSSEMFGSSSPPHNEETPFGLGHPTAPRRSSATGRPETTGMRMASSSSTGLDWERYLRFDDRYLRPTEADAMVGGRVEGRIEVGMETAGAHPKLTEMMATADIRALE